MQDFRRKDRAHRDAAKTIAHGGMALGLAIALAAVPTARPAMAQVIVDSGVLDALGPAENLPGLLHGPVARDGRAPSPWPAAPMAAGNAMTLRDDPVSAPRSRLHVAPPSRRAALVPAAPVTRPRPAALPARPAAVAQPPALSPTFAPVAAPVKVAAAPMTKPVAPPLASRVTTPVAAPVAVAVAVPAPAQAPVAKPAAAPISIEAVNAAGDALPPPAPPLRAEPQAPKAAPPVAAQPSSPSPPPSLPVARPQNPAVAALPHATPGQVSIGFSGEDTALGTDAQQNLERVAKRLMDDAGVQAQILAYASAPDGNASRARRVSLARALSTRGFLMDRGVASDRIEVRALGDKVPDGAPDRVDVRLVTP